MQSGTVFSLGGFSLRHLKPHRLSQVESMGHFFSNLRCCSSTTFVLWSKLRSNKLLSVVVPLHLW